MGRTIDPLQELDRTTLERVGPRRAATVLIVIGCLVAALGVVELVADLGRSPFLTLFIGGVSIVYGVRQRRSVAEAAAGSARPGAAGST